MVAADVMELKAQPLHLFKVVVYSEDLGEHRADAAADHLGPVHLKPRQHVLSEHCLMSDCQPADKNKTVCLTHRCLIEERLLEKNNQKPFMKTTPGFLFNLHWMCKSGNRCVCHQKADFLLL